MVTNQHGYTVKQTHTHTTHTFEEETNGKKKMKMI